MASPLQRSGLEVDRRVRYRVHCPVCEYVTGWFFNESDAYLAHHAHFDFLVHREAVTAQRGSRTP